MRAPGDELDLGVREIHKEPIIFFFKFMVEVWDQIWMF